jgi:hypothetical protein
MTEAPEQRKEAMEREVWGAKDFDNENDNEDEHDSREA